MLLPLIAFLDARDIAGSDGEVFISVLVTAIFMAFFGFRVAQSSKKQKHWDYGGRVGRILPD